MMNAADEPAHAVSPPYDRPVYRWYVLIVLTAVYACHGMDRSMPSILVEPVRHEFHLTDAQLGLFSGLGYGVAFAAAALPMGYISDRTNRRNFLAAVVALWSMFTMLGGLAKGYTILVLTRIGVGAMESGATPATLPVLAATFPANQRTLAFSIFYLGVPLGGFLAATLGGYVASQYGWRFALLLAGVPGLLMACLLLLTVSEPKGARRGSAEPPPTMPEVLRFLIATPALMYVVFGGATIALIAVSLGAWTSSFFVRIYGLDLKFVGLLLGLSAIAQALVGPPIGWLADRLAARNRRWPLRLVLISSLIGLFAGLLMLFSPVLWLSMLGFFLGDLLRISYSPLTFAVLIAHSPSRMHGAIVSTVQLITYLAAFGIGPVMIGVLSDFYGGGKSIRMALATAVGLYLLAITLVSIAIRLLYPKQLGVLA